MYQIADNQLIETLDLFTVIQSFWNGMVPLLVGMIGKFRTMVLVLQKMVLFTSLQTVRSLHQFGHIVRATRPSQDHS